MTRTKKVLIAILIILLIAGVGGFLFWRNMSPAGEGDAVYMFKVSDITGNQLSADRYSGVVEAQKTQSYNKDGERTIETIYVEVGQTVAQGTPLFKYDVKEAQNAIDSLNLDIEGTNNEIEVLRNSGNSTEVQLAIAERELDIKQKQAEIEKYNQQIEQAEVLSTTAGTVKTVNPEGGYDNNGKELPVVSVTEEGDFRVKGKVSEQTIGLLTVGQDVVIRSRVDETQVWKGMINNIDTEPETNQNDMYYYGSSGESASTYPFYVSLESTDGLMLGQHVFIEPDYGQSEVKEGMWLDQNFVVMEDGGAYVWSAKNGRIVKKTVELGEIDDELYEVQITGGLNQDDLITWPDETITEGMKAVDISEEQ